MIVMVVTIAAIIDAADSGLAKLEEHVRVIHHTGEQGGATAKGG